MTQLRWAIAQAKEAFVPPDLERPTPDVDPDDDDWLYSSDRTYLEQLRYYHAHKAGLTVEAWEAREAAARDEDARRRALGSMALDLPDEEVMAPFPEGCPPYDRRTRMLAKLCPKGHEHGTTGQSLYPRRKGQSRGQCLKCQAERMAAGRKHRADDDEDGDG
jgi:hypothetical protein